MDGETRDTPRWTNPQRVFSRHTQPAVIKRLPHPRPSRRQPVRWSMHVHTQAVLASRGGPTHAAWRTFYEQQAGARAARQRDLEHDLFRAWSAYLASGGK